MGGGRYSDQTPCPILHEYMRPAWDLQECCVFDFHSPSRGNRTVNGFYKRASANAEIVRRRDSTVCSVKAVPLFGKTRSLRRHDIESSPLDRIGVQFYKIFPVPPPW